MTEHEKTVSMTALKFHTRGDKTHAVGDTYDALEAEVANLVAQGMAKPTVEAEKDAAAAKARDSHPVSPMTTDDFHKS